MKTIEQTKTGEKPKFTQEYQNKINELTFQSIGTQINTIKKSKENVKIKIKIKFTIDQNEHNKKLQELAARMSIQASTEVLMEFQKASESIAACKKNIEKQLDNYDPCNVDFLTAEQNYLQFLVDNQNPIIEFQNLLNAAQKEFIDIGDEIQKFTEDQDRIIPIGNSTVSQGILHEYLALYHRRIEKIDPALKGLAATQHENPARTDYGLVLSKALLSHKKIIDEFIKSKSVNGRKMSLEWTGTGYRAEYCINFKKPAAIKRATSDLVACQKYPVESTWNPWLWVREQKVLVNDTPLDGSQRYLSFLRKIAPVCVGRMDLGPLTGLTETNKSLGFSPSVGSLTQVAIRENPKFISWKCLYTSYTCTSGRNTYLINEKEPGFTKQEAVKACMRAINKKFTLCDIVHSKQYLSTLEGYTCHISTKSSCERGESIPFMLMNSTHQTPEVFGSPKEARRRCELFAKSKNEVVCDVYWTSWY
ncbi:MAG: hypothetical protein KA715_13845 [Xanthomonadaceae bacterium]|nr:hypothetical protein [Xanthomonadaceae bacterium]